MGNNTSDLRPLANAQPLSDLDVDSKFETKRTQAPQQQSPLQPRPIRRVLYKLPIRFQVLPGDSRNPLDQEDILDAYEMCVAPNVWQPFLQLSMESAWIKATNKDIDPECGEFRIVHLQTAIKAKCIGVALLKTAERGVYEGVVYWKSCEIPLEIIQEELEWHISGLLSYSYISDSDGRWLTNIEIGGVLQE